MSVCYGTILLCFEDNNFPNVYYESLSFFYCCTVHFDIYKVRTPANALFIKFEKVLKCVYCSLYWVRRTQHNEEYTYHTYDMLPHQRIAYNDLVFFNEF